MGGPPSLNTEHKAWHLPGIWRSGGGSSDTWRSCSNRGCVLVLGCDCRSEYGGARFWTN